MRLWTVLMVTGLLCAASAGAVDKKKGAKPAAEQKMDAEHQAMMAKMTEFATPSQGHKALEPFAGTWDHTVRWWMEPGVPPHESQGTSEAKWILGGRFLQTSAQGMSMGQPFEGMGLMGYDNFKKEYNGIWIDNMGTGIMKAAGSYDPAARTFTEKGTFTDPMAGEKSFLGVTKLADNYNYTYEFYTTDNKGQEFRMMEIVYKRRK
jgi:hypothetical protein